MVKLSKADKEQIRDAVAHAEQHTDAEIAIVVAGMSDVYHAATMACGFSLGSLLATALMLTHHLNTIMGFMLIQFAVTTLFLIMPALHYCGVWLTPKAIRKQHATRCAAAEYLALRNLSQKPLLFVYLSLAERYIHIHCTDDIRRKWDLPYWQSKLGPFAGVGGGEFVTALTSLIRESGEALRRDFPGEGNPHTVENYIER